MKDLIRKILREEVEEKVIKIPNLHYFGNTETPTDRFESFNNILKFIGNRKFKINGDLDLRYTLIKSLGNLQSVGGGLYLEGTPIKSLGNLQSVGGGLDLYETSIESLGNLQSVGGSLDLYGTPISRKYSREEIRQMVNVEGRIFM